MKNSKIWSEGFVDNHIKMSCVPLHKNWGKIGRALGISPKFWLKFTHFFIYRDFPIYSLPPEMANKN